MATVERATIEKTRTFPEWLKRAIEIERRDLAGIIDPVKRRLAEIEIDAMESRIKTEIAEGR